VTPWPRSASISSAPSGYSPGRSAHVATATLGDRGCPPNTLATEPSPGNLGEKDQVDTGMLAAAIGTIIKFYELKKYAK
jgi:hypothetical protein